MLEDSLVNPPSETEEPEPEFKEPLAILPASTHNANTPRVQATNGAANILENTFF